MDQDISQKLDEQSKKLDAIEKSVKKIKSYLFWTVMASIILFVVPLIGIIIILPKFLNIYSSYSSVGL